MSSYCKVWINGKEWEGDPERKLLDVLRNDLKCKSVKPVRFWRTGRP